MDQTRLESETESLIRARRPNRERARRTWFAMGARGLCAAIAFGACSSPASINGTGNSVPAYLIVTNYGSLSAILTVDLQPPVQSHVQINECLSLPLSVPVNDTVKVIITDSTATTSASWEVPFYLGGVWGVDVAQGSGPPVILGNIGVVSTNCSTQEGG
jgi:hypothetical protein